MVKYMFKKINKQYKLIILCIIIFEVFVCNYQSIKSHIMNYSEIVYKSPNIEEKDTSIQVELKDINTKIYNIYIDYTNAIGITSESIVEIYYTDELFSGYEKNSGSEKIIKHKMIDKYEKSKYIKCDFVGNTGKILLNIRNDSKIEINNIIINKKVPFNFMRVTLLILITTGIYLILNKKFFKEEFDIKNKNQQLILCFISFGFIILLCVIQDGISKNNIWNIAINELYGKDLVNSIIEGKININVDSQLLENLRNAKNPYDYNEIAKYYEAKKGFDVAYFNGNIYLYYGILPALILLLPIHLITGNYLTIDLRNIYIFSYKCNFHNKTFKRSHI